MTALLSLLTLGAIVLYPAGRRPDRRDGDKHDQNNPIIKIGL